MRQMTPRECYYVAVNAVTTSTKKRAIYLWEHDITLQEAPASLMPDDVVLIWSWVCEPRELEHVGPHFARLLRSMFCQHSRVHLILILPYCKPSFDIFLIFFHDI